MASRRLAQANYEIQVYGSETIPRRATMFEMHTNFIFQGTKQAVDGVRPTNHQLHETHVVLRTGASPCRNLLASSRVRGRRIAIETPPWQFPPVGRGKVSSFHPLWGI